MSLTIIVITALVEAYLYRRHKAESVTSASQKRDAHRALHARNMRLA